MQLINGNASVGMNGLQLKCNKNFGTKQYDFLQTSGVLAEQGVCSSFPTTPANNTFSHYSNTLKSDLNAYSAGGFIYNYPLTPLNGDQDPIYYTSNVTKFGCNGPPFDYNPSCPSRLTSTTVVGTLPGIYAQLEARAMAFKETADNLTTILDELLSAGSSPNLTTLINSNLSDFQVKTVLLTHSPYLSDDVIIGYLTRSIAPSVANLKEVIVANSPVSTPVKNVILNLNLPVNIMNEIELAQSGTNSKIEKQQEIAYYVYNKDLTVNEIVREALMDTATANTNDIIRKWLNWNNNRIAKSDLVFHEIETHNFARAQVLIDSLSLVTNDPPFIDFMQNYKNLAVSNLTWEELKNDPALKAKTIALAYDSLKPLMGNARAALDIAFANNANYEVVEGVAPNIGSRLAQQQVAVKNESSAIFDGRVVSISAYPNPFNSNININYTLMDDTQGPIEIKLIEMATGRLISKQSSLNLTDVIQFNTEALAAGMYMVNISAGNLSLSNTKVINIK
jgi:hypothetical protein